MSDADLPDDPIDRRASAAASALIETFADLDVEADLAATRHGTRTYVARSRNRTWLAGVAALSIVVAGTVALVAVSDSRSTSPVLAPTTPQPTLEPAPNSSAVPTASTSLPETSTTTSVAISNSATASVSYLDPPPELALRPLGTVAVPAERSGAYSVAVGDLGVAVSQWMYDDGSTGRLDVVDFGGGIREFPTVIGDPLLAYGPGDVVYTTRSGTAIDEFAVVAIALGADGGTEVRREREDVNVFIEYPPMSFGHAAAGVIHRREYLAEEPPIIDYVDVDGQPVTLADASPTFRFETPERTGADLGGTIISSAGDRWTLTVDAAPDRAGSYVGASPPVPGTAGHGIYVTHIGPDADPSTDFGVPTLWVIADLQPGGTASWWTIPAGWEVIASDAWGTVLGRRTGTTLELAIAELPTTPTTEPPAAGTPCAGLADPSTASGQVVEVVACRQWSDGEQAIVQRSDADTSPAYSVTGDWLPYGATGDVELVGPFPIDGLDGVVAFRGTLESVDCLVLVAPREPGWGEICGASDGETPPILTRNGNDLVQIDQVGNTLRGVVLTEMWPDSGCTLADARTIYDAAVGPSFGGQPMPSVVFTAFGCVGDNAAGTVGSVYLQPGPVDGSIYLFERDVAGWTVTVRGTGIDSHPATAVPRLDT